MSSLTSRVESTVERTFDLSKSLIMVALVIGAAIAWNVTVGLFVKSVAGPVLKNQGMYHIGFAVLMTLAVVVMAESFDMKAELPISEGYSGFIAIPENDGKSDTSFTLAKNGGSASNYGAISVAELNQIRNQGARVAEMEELRATQFQ